MCSKSNQILPPPFSENFHYLASLPQWPATARHIQAPGSWVYRYGHVARVTSSDALTVTEPHHSVVLSKPIRMKVCTFKLWGVMQERKIKRQKEGRGRGMGPTNGGQVKGKSWSHRTLRSPSNLLFCFVLCVLSVLANCTSPAAMTMVAVIPQNTTWGL